MGGAELAVALVIGAVIGVPLGLYIRARGKHGRHFTPEEIRAFADGLRAELLERASVPGEWVDLGEFLGRQPYVGMPTWRGAVIGALMSDGTLAEMPKPFSDVDGGLSFRLSARAWTEFHTARAVGPRTELPSEGQE
ncbi:hypothetical protein [Kitasatospora sp. NPDC085879]|uniref:hypothetical protein n=1 Tax=Kitasatospora sp. NPDC085879 TaxID=3154769 RepID=UPI00341DC43E